MWLCGCVACGGVVCRMLVCMAVGGWRAERVGGWHVALWAVAQRLCGLVGGVACVLLVVLQLVWWRRACWRCDACGVSGSASLYRTWGNWLVCGWGGALRGAGSWVLWHVGGDPLVNGPAGDGCPARRPTMVVVGAGHSQRGGLLVKRHPAVSAGRADPASVAPAAVGVVHGTHQWSPVQGHHQ